MRSSGPACSRTPGTRPTAVATLAYGLELAETERLRRPFLDAPPPLRRLLRAHPPLVAAGAWLNPASPVVPSPRRPVEATARSSATEPPEAIIDPLSPRELDVLRLLAEMLSTTEIAAALFVSINTVRTHIRSILRKLGVTRRNDAVRRARDLHLLERDGPTAGDAPAPGSRRGRRAARRGGTVRAG